LLGDARNMGIVYVDQDVVVDGDLVTGRTGGHCHQFARMIIDILSGVVKPGPGTKPIEIDKPLSR
jgi:protease I